ncbi:CPBP family intramembrane metalloprotease [Schaalia sp. 19OD2882]|uniref:hypothetical protein n=1 Tax=Schaalia sp. 19OD2882 TaxID=2794089 RepID=UPI001C1EA8B8|nr:hypothetical protein [Schaalia sp. 19OD2882]QWW19675.1 CPBP family intramembrane metalloprotease [Schaalia sp. 19OD2882]
MRRVASCDAFPSSVVGHDHDRKGLVDIGVFAPCAGWLHVRTDGLEVLIAMHVVNNMSALVAGMLGLSDPTGMNVPRVGRGVRGGPDTGHDDPRRRPVANEAFSTR